MIKAKMRKDVRTFGTKLSHAPIESTNITFLPPLSSKMEDSLDLSSILSSTSSKGKRRGKPFKTKLEPVIEEEMRNETSEDDSIFERRAKRKPKQIKEESITVTKQATTGSRNVNIHEERSGLSRAPLSTISSGNVVVAHQQKQRQLQERKQQEQQKELHQNRANIPRKQTDNRIKSRKSGIDDVTENFEMKIDEPSPKRKRPLENQSEIFPSTRRILAKLEIESDEDKDNIQANGMDTLDSQRESINSGMSLEAEEDISQYLGNQTQEFEDIGVDSQDFEPQSDSSNELRSKTRTRKLFSTRDLDLTISKKTNKPYDTAPVSKDKRGSSSSSDHYTTSSPEKATDEDSSPARPSKLMRKFGNPTPGAKLSISHSPQSSSDDDFIPIKRETSMLVIPPSKFRKENVAKLRSIVRKASTS